MAEIVVGIDPGSYRTGFAVLRREGRRISVVHSGVIQLAAKQPLADRLSRLSCELTAVVEAHPLTGAAVEDVFTHRNARSALALGQARGAALAVLGGRSLEVHAYPPATVKRAVAGHGRAGKVQVQAMVTRLLSLSSPPKEDEADAMAIALCHLMGRRVAAQIRGRGASRVKLRRSNTSRIRNAASISGDE